MKLAKYIHDLLLENESVIIPGLGAFFSTYKPAETNDNEIKPPYKEITFTNKIRTNDGMLVTAIARKAKISQPNALKRIERERENILYKLDKGENVVIEQVGILFNNDKNEISFTPFHEDNLLIESYGFQPVSFDDVVEDTIEPVIDEIISEPESEPEQVNTVVENISEPEMKPTISESVNEAVEVPVIEKKTEPIKLPEFKKEHFTVYPEKMERSGWYWLLLILIPVFVGGYFIINKFTSSRTDKFVESPPQIKKQETFVQPVAPSDSAENENFPEEENVEMVKPETTTNPVSENTRFYIVGGGFKNQENAEKFVVRLKERNIDGIMLGQKGSMYLVGIASFNTENEAYNSLNEYVKKYPDWNLWVFEK